MTRMLTNRFCRAALFCSLALFALPAWGQIGSRDITESGLTIQEQREATLLWLDTFLTESQLLRQDDVQKIRAAVANMSASQLEQWLAQTAQLREYVEGEQWQNTKQWLREFLRVQAIYSDAELQQVRDELVRADADQMLAILKRIQAKHDSLTWMHEAAVRNRRIEVAERDAYAAQQAAAAQAARAQRRSGTWAVVRSGLAGRISPEAVPRLPGPSPANRLTQHVTSRCLGRVMGARIPDRILNPRR